jgi:hypothetical protein
MCLNPSPAPVAMCSYRFCCNVMEGGIDGLSSCGHSTASTSQKGSQAERYSFTTCSNSSGLSLLPLFLGDPPITVEPPH